MKAGTSSLHSYLDAHPDVHMSKRKELDFFVETKSWRRGVDWYRSQFDPTVPVNGESSPNYTKAPSFAGVTDTVREVMDLTELTSAFELQASIGGSNTVCTCQGGSMSISQAQHVVRELAIELAIVFNNGFLPELAESSKEAGTPRFIPSFCAHVLTASASRARSEASIAAIRMRGKRQPPTLEAHQFC